MKAIKFSKDSWHWHIASKYGPISGEYSYEGDICSYTRALMKGMLVLALLSLAGFLLSYSLLDFIFWAYVSLTISPLLINPTGILAPAIIFVIGGSVALLWASDKISRWRRERYIKLLTDEEVEEKKESLMKHWVRKVKDKTCFRVEIT